MSEGDSKPIVFVTGWCLFLRRKPCPIKGNLVFPSDKKDLERTSLMVITDLSDVLWPEPSKCINYWWVFGNEMSNHISDIDLEKVNCQSNGIIWNRQYWLYNRWLFPEPVMLFIWTSIRYLLVTVVQIIWNECYLFHHIFYIIVMTSASNII